MASTDWHRCTALCVPQRRFRYARRLAVHAQRCRRQPVGAAGGLERDLHRSRAAFRFAVEDGFDIVAVGVEDEGGVVAGVIRAFAGGAVVLAAAG